MSRNRSDKSVAELLTPLDPVQWLHERAHKSRRQPKPSKQDVFAAKLRDAESQFYDLDYSGTVLVRATLVAHGFALNDTGRWQKQEGSGLPVSWTVEKMFAWPEGNKLLNYMHSVEQGDLTALSALRSAIAEGMTWDYPVYVLIGAEEAYLGLINCRTRKQRETLSKQRDAFETECGVERATALEKFLIRWVFTGQLRMQFAHSP